MSWLKYIVPLVGMEEIRCDHCRGRGRNSRGEPCWTCKQSGTRIVRRADLR